LTEDCGHLFDDDFVHTARDQDRSAVGCWNRWLASLLAP